VKLSYYIVFSRFYYLLAKYTSGGSPFQKAAFLISIFQTMLFMALLNATNSSFNISSQTLNYIGMGLFLANSAIHLIFFTVKKKYLRLFFYSQKKGVRKMDFILLIFFFAFVVSVIYLIG